MTAPTLLAAVDADGSADEVVATALVHARALGARLVLAHVVPDAATVFPEGRVATAAQPDGVPLPPVAVDDARAWLDPLAERCRAAGVVTEAVVSRGPAAATVIDLVDAWDAMLVVVGTHARTGLGRLLVGSVAEAILRHTPVPLLAVPTRPTAG